MKKLGFIFFVSSIYPMQHKKEVPDLVSLCLKIIDKEIKEKILDDQCGLLAQKIDANFPLETLKEYPAHTTYLLPREQLNLSKAIRTLNQISTICHENDFLKITPVSIEIICLPHQLGQRIVNPSASETITEIQKMVFEKLYTKSLVIIFCMEIYMYHQDSGDYTDLIKTVKDIPGVMRCFSTLKNVKALLVRQQEEREKRDNPLTEYYPFSM